MKKNDFYLTKSASHYSGNLHLSTHQSAIRHLSHVLLHVVNHVFADNGMVDAINQGMGLAASPRRLAQGIKGFDAGGSMALGFKWLSQPAARPITHRFRLFKY